jgi:hypothetical protein
MSLGGYTLGTGVTNACLYRVGYLAWEMLEHMMLRITEHGAGFRRTRYAKALIFPGFLSFPTKGRLFKYISLNLSTILFLIYPHLFVFPERDIQKP